MKKNLLLFALSLSIFGLAKGQNESHLNLMDQYNVHHYNLDLEIGSDSEYISGNVTVTASAEALQIDTFAIELINTLVANQTYMVVDSVLADGSVSNFTHEQDVLTIPFENPKDQGEIFSVRIYYHGMAKPLNPETSFKTGIFLTDDQSKSFSLSQPKGSKFWWPCKQDLTDKADSVTFYITTDNKNTSGSNGLLMSATNLPDNKIRYKWVTKHPIDYYLISFVVGDFKEVISYAPTQEGKDSVLLQNFLNEFSPHYQKNLEAIDKTKDLIQTFSEVFGEYPFKDEKYGYGAVQSKIGGMEHQTLTTINEELLLAIPDFNTSYAWVIAHELAHQWFGNYVTCKTWNDIWINEGFASYLEYVALEKMELNTLAEQWLNIAHAVALGIESKSVFVPDSALNDPARLFSFPTVYKKGALILHTLRYEINNDTLFFSGLKNFLDEFGYSNASAEDFKNAMKETTGYDLHDFFDQWYYGVGYPLFTIEWQQKNDTLFITSDQTTTYSNPAVFITHFDIRFNFASGDTLMRLYQNSNHCDFKIPMKKPTLSVEFDPDYWLLKRVEVIDLSKIVTAANEGKSPDINLLTVYPNPHLGFVNFKLYSPNSQIVCLDILDIDGQIVESKNLPANIGENTFSIKTSLKKGVYFYRITTNQNILTGKLVKL